MKEADIKNEEEYDSYAALMEDAFNYYLIKCKEAGIEPLIFSVWRDRAGRIHTNPKMKRYIYGDLIDKKKKQNLFDNEGSIGINEAVNNPSYYGGDTVYEVIKVIHAWKLGFSLGNAVKYIGRAGKKHPEKEIEDLEKAIWYMKDRIKELKNKQKQKL